MARSGALLEATVQFFSGLALRSVELCRQTQEDLRTDAFDAQKTIGRGLSLWLDATEGFFSAALVAANGPVPTLFLHVTKEATSVSNRVNALIPQGKTVQSTPLRQIGGTEHVADKRFKVVVTSTSDAIDATLAGLKDKRPASGLYESLVYAAEQPIAIILAQID